MMQTKLSKQQYRGKERKGVDLSTMVYGKIPPQDRELEKAILGAIMLERKAYDIAAEILKAGCFYVDAHQKIFDAMRRLNERSIPIDVLTVIDELRRSSELEAIGGPFMLTKLTQDVTSAANIEAHCRIVLQKFMRREMIRISGEAMSAAYSDEEDVFEILDKMGSDVFQVTNTYVKRDFVTMDRALVEAMKRLDTLRGQEFKITGVPTGYPNLDEITRGWQPTDLVIIAARPAVGKTAFVINLLRNAALHHQKPTGVALFSLEMGRLQITNRLLSAETQVPLSHISNGEISDPELKMIHEKGINRLAKAKIFIDDTAGLTMLELRAKARRLVDKHKVGLIVIDYLQLMTGDNKSQNREQEISKISRQLKIMAKDLEVPVIALSQLSRAIENRKGQPQLSDLRESGAIEQDADMVMFLYRPSEDDVKNDSSLQDTGQVLIRKHRNGKLGDIFFRVFNEIQSWMDLEQGDIYLSGRSVPTNWGNSQALSSFRNRAANDFSEDPDTPF